MDDTAWKTAWELARQIDCLPTISHERDRLIRAIAAALRAERAAGRSEAAQVAAARPETTRDGIHVVQLHPKAGACMHCGASRDVFGFSLGGFQARLCGDCLREFAATTRFLFAE